MSDAARSYDDFFDGSDYFTGPPLTDAMVVDVERTLGYSLPQSYLRLLPASFRNGRGEVCWEVGATGFEPVTPAV